MGLFYPYECLEKVVLFDYFVRTIVEFSLDRRFYPSHNLYLKLEESTNTPMKKTILIDEIMHAHQQLCDCIASLSAEDLMTPKTCGEWSVKDILAHITDWEQRILDWYRTGLRGETPQAPEPGYDWNEVDAVNQAGYLKHKDQPLNAVLEEFTQSWEEVLPGIEGMSEKALYDKDQFEWLEDYLLVDVVTNNTLDHYQEHLKSIQSWMESRRITGS